MSGHTRRYTTPYYPWAGGVSRGKDLQRVEPRSERGRDSGSGGEKAGSDTDSNGEYTSDSDGEPEAPFCPSLSLSLFLSR